MLEIRKEFLPMSRPAIGGEEIEAVAASMRSGWIASGPRVAGLEERFGALSGAPHAVAVASATAGMHLVLTVPGVVRERYGTKEGDLPGCERAGSRILSLPLFPGMADADADCVRAAVREILAEAGA